MKTKVSKIRPLTQVQESESGSTCLAMVAACYGKWLPLIKASELCAVTKEGCSIDEIAKGAEVSGFRSEIFSREDSGFEWAEYSGVPVIVQLNNLKYIIVERVRNDTFYCVSPEKGRVKMSGETFENLWCGAGLVLSPGDNFDTSGEKVSPLRFACDIIKKSGKSRFSRLIGVMTAAMVLMVLFPYMNSYYVDHRISFGDSGTGTIFLVVYAVCLLALIILEILDVRSYTDYISSLSMNNNKDFFWNLINLPVVFFSKRKRGYFLDCKDQNNDVVFALGTQMLEFVIKLVTMLICTISIGVLSPSLLGVLIIMIVLTYYLLGIFTAKKQLVYQELYSGKMATDSFTLDVLDVIDNIKNYGAGNAFAREFARLSGEDIEFEAVYHHQTIIADAVPAFLASLTKLLIIATGAFFIRAGNLTFGVIVAVQGFYSMIESPIAFISSVASYFFSTKYSLENLQAVSDAAEENLSIQNCEMPGEKTKLKGHIEINGITFGYHPYKPPLFEDFSLEIKPGESVALVGFSGCGKSTLKDLITGKLNCSKGEILYDGRLRSEIPDIVFASSLASVDQQITLFPDTVMQNIKMWDESIFDFDAILAAKDAGIHFPLMDRPKGYNSIIEEGGKNFSGGERQRIEIARALALDPTILILDEATSALDTIVEKRIAEHVRDRNITMLIIAHRLSTIRLCDKIVVMENGKILDSGTHDELMARCGVYSELVTVE